MNKKIFLLVFSLILMTAKLFAQDELLSPIRYNQAIKSHLVTVNKETLYQKSGMVDDTLKLPFYDDFSGPGIYPDPEKWEDNDVFINGTYAKSPPTVGMATFDGINSIGDPYDNSSLSTYGETDRLTSKPLDLYEDNNGNLYTSADSITFSFYYQRRGLGDTPEFGDSLQLLFWEPTSDTTGNWHWQWSLDGGTFDFGFTRVFIKITDPVLFKKGFKFRFQSYGSLTGSLDNWNVDYVILRKPFFPNDILINDIGYRLPAHSLLNTFTSIPYDHYKYLGSAGQANLVKTTDNLKVFNLFNTASAPSQANFRIFDEGGSLQFQYVTSGNGNIVIPANSAIIYTYPNPPLTYQFPDTIPGDYAKFTLVDNLASPNQDFNKSNDTVKYSQIFSNYYAYDDGTSEAGYNLNNAPGGKLAYQFDFIKPDTLRGMYIHWNQQYANVSLKLFKMVIWQSLNPEVVLYQEINQKPLYFDSINGFRYYEFDNIITLPAGTFYIGLVQSAPDALYLGFDVNTDNNNKMFYNVTGTWQNSQIPGSFMFRPVFGDSVLLAGISEVNNASLEFNIYPNPGSDNISVYTNIGSTNQVYYSLQNITGSTVIDKRPYSSQIDVSKLPSGFYFLTFYDAVNKFHQTKKLIIQR